VVDIFVACTSNGFADMRNTAVYRAQQSPCPNDRLTVFKRTTWLVFYGLITLPFTLFWLLIVGFFSLVRPWLHLRYLPAAREFDELFSLSQNYRWYFSHLAMLDRSRRWIGEAIVSGEGQGAYRLILSLPIAIWWLPLRAIESGKPNCMVSEGWLTLRNVSDGEPSQFRLDSNGHHDLWKEDEWSIVATFLLKETEHGQRCVNVRDIREAIDLIDRQRGSTQPLFAGAGSR
jgi:hypothetical protein